ncbi:MAG: oligopeptide transporter, OPT family [Acidobacteriota bacterium]|nr:MAG: oligopeptide transporter, OPT family [Acidobacteriota bacterium]
MATDIEGVSVQSSTRAATFRPFIGEETRLRELTILPLILGTLLGIVFGASSLYLVLKTGLTVSASIPVAVISITIFRLLSKVGLRNATILENNIVQTAGSAGESIAFGFGATMPAIMILGFDLEILNVMLVGVLGGLLGILMMIPLRRALIVEQHGVLKYPEGTACAEVLKAGADDESLEEAAKAGTAEISAVKIGARTIFTGFGIGLAYKSLMSAFRMWKEVPERVFGAPFKGGSLSAEISPELLGVGFIIGPYISGLMVGGGILAYLVLIPAIKFFGDGLSEPLAPGTVPISQMTPDDVRSAYILYIGAGSVAAAGIISMVRSLPTIWAGLKGGLSDLKGARLAGAQKRRTDQDLSMKWVIGGIVLLVILILAFRSLQMNLIGAIMIVLFGFLFVTVSSRLTGEVGSSSNPISGMTVATLLLTCLIFVIVGWTTPPYYVTALSVGAIVCIAASNGGTTSQDLKTGFLVGATPRHQQVAILFGSLASALLLGPILIQLNQTGTVYVPVKDTPAIEYRADVSQLKQRQPLTGPQAGDDANSYFVWYRTDNAGNAQKFLVNDQGVPVYQVDPGINGTVDKRPDGTSVPKFDAPKATLMSYIIKGILDRKLPWALVLLGVMITLMLEASGVPSLAFAVGVYLPLSTSAPIFVGGAIRWLVDLALRKKLASKNLTQEQFNAETDKSPGVLMASGYIAGGAIAGIVIAFLAGVTVETNRRIEEWSAAFNPFYQGDWSNLLSLIPFLLLVVLLYLTGREMILKHR